MTKRGLVRLLFVLFALCSCWQPAFAAPAAQPQLNQPELTTKMAVLAGLALLPFAIMLLTSFLKMVIVLSLLRQAIGVQNAPPNQVINGIALLMAIYVMFPVGVAVYDQTKDYIAKESQKTTELFSTQSAEFIANVINLGKQPLKEFLIRNTTQTNIKYFYKLAYSKFPAEYQSQLSPTDFLVVIPSFITSQVRGAFEIGVLIYLPFFIIDLVTSNILLAMGMMMLSPLTIALPLKLLLLVMVDGWTLIVEGVVLTFK
ncbi:MAG: Flagellar biosynthetic protein FliP [Chlamydiia bacterium]|nr:Flagellar biosynthetic protein FliP [Chlamydiia bacterium]